MELKDTIELMNSADYKDRFKAEYYQTAIRLKKLVEMVKAWDKGELNFTPTCDRDTYADQIRYMSSYIAVLEMRSIAEDIELEVIA